MTQPNALFVREGDRFVPTGIGTSPWTGNTIGGVPLAALSAHLLDALPAPTAMLPARISIDILGTPPVAPLESAARVVRDGKRVQLLEAELSSAGRTWVRATMLRVREDETPPGPKATPPVFPSGNLPNRSDLCETIPMSDRAEPTGHGVWWVRFVPETVAGVPLAGLERAAMLADFGSGISAMLPLREWTFANVDITLHLTRRPRGEWLQIEAWSGSAGNGIGIARSRLSDFDGVFGHGAQTIFLARR